jgi:hypothetical protein
MKFIKNKIIKNIFQRYYATSEESIEKLIRKYIKVNDIKVKDISGGNFY